MEKMKRAAAVILGLVLAWNFKYSFLSDDQRVWIIEALFSTFQKTPVVETTDSSEILVDARTAEEQEVSMIKGAITQKEFESRAEEFRSKKVVVYCTVGYRSGMYTKELREKGFDAYNLRGGILLWTHHGGELIHNETKTNRIHVYGSMWNLAPRSWDASW